MQLAKSSPPPPENAFIHPEVKCGVTRFITTRPKKDTHYAEILTHIHTALNRRVSIVKVASSIYNVASQKRRDRS